MRDLDWAKLSNYLAFGVIGLGFLAMYLGWNGAANKACVDCQIPYLISGAAVGLGLIATGLGVLVVQNGRRNRLELERQLEAIGEAIERNGTGGGAAGGRTATTQRVARGEVLATDETYHTPACALVRGRDAEPISKRQAQGRGLEACRVCNP